MLHVKTYALSNCGCDSVLLITKLTLNLTLSHPHNALPDPKRVKSLLRSPNSSHINHQTCRPTLKTCHVLIVIVISKLLKRYSKAKRTRAPAYSRALRRIKGGFPKVGSREAQVRGDQSRYWD